MYRGEYIVYDGGGGGEVSPFVYCAVQKVGCSSVKRALAPLFDLAFPDASSGDVRRAMDVHDAFNASPHQVSRETLILGLQSGRYAGHLRFAFVRNPYDRLLSCYRQKLADDGAQGLSKYDFGGVRLRKGMPFREFARAVAEIPDSIADAHFRSQYLSTHDDAGDPLADTIGRFETLARDFSAVAQRIGLRGKLPHLMRSNGGERHYADFYDERTARLVASRYGTDLELFGYAF